ncbi:mitochondrial ATP synthase g subunit-domain-containing protein [Radiomyces spectabilis]|uniref:mitochondrial ATP synthase g subunit-domain-containing protein n=1 Tax=Radiomyces spectabilis TaxID=64574 RepID=UPI00221FE220|nr:mitochondrial ATP synthase g subunit-domain-containing protein [Radiomyces spectabilis]KAI8388801.1 mitochondrial ATP synthase g subunit-domain-containing protein [Radiomyces spectabilis]
MSASKFIGALQSTLSKVTALQRPIVYNAKVAGEIAKQVYVKEGMAFPSGEQFTQARQIIQKNMNVAALKNLTWRDIAQGGVVAAEIYTFFLIGEIIGRRNLIGYNVKSVDAHHH